MDCPECGGPLSDYRLGDRAAVGCDDCGYVGIDAEHRVPRVDRESWADAIERFYREHGTTAVRDASLGGPDGSGETEGSEVGSGETEETDRTSADEAAGTAGQ